MFETIAHLLGEGFELLRRASSPDAVRRRLIRQRDRAYRRYCYWAERTGRRASRKANVWRRWYNALDAEIRRVMP